MLKHHKNFDIMVHYGTPSRCSFCGKELQTGQRCVTDGERTFDSCKCEQEYRHSQ